MRRTESKSDRWVHHVLVAFLVLFAVTSQTDNPLGPQFISTVHATGVIGNAMVVTTEPPVLTTPVISRSSTSTRSPLPTPVPIDPNATPLPGPTQAPPPPPPQPPAQPEPLAGMTWPVADGQMSQYYSAGHPALDIAADYGDNVYAAQGGTVIWAAWKNNGGGYVVEIDHGSGVTTGYNHLSAIYVSVGQWVATGTPIAAVGCSGWCSGPHVHFVLTINGWYADPLGFL